MQPLKKGIREIGREYKVVNKIKVLKRLGVICAELSSVELDYIVLTCSSLRSTDTYTDYGLT